MDHIWRRDASNLASRSELLSATTPSTVGTMIGGRSIKCWNQTVDMQEEYVQKIRERGGEFFFVRLPGDPPRTEQRFPKNIFWDELTRRGLRTLHYSEELELSSFVSPDNTHLDAEVAPEFTLHFCRRLERKFYNVAVTGE